jgi:hypothetical protein
MIICKNCGAEYSGKFCNHCGQKASVGRLNWHYLWHEAQHNILHFDRNLFTVLKNLFLRPASAIREYLQGKRVAHFSPFAMLVAFGTAAALLTHLLDIPTDYTVNNGVVSPPVIPHSPIAQTLLWLQEHHFADLIAKLPLYAFCSWILFWRYRYNFVEHLAIHAFCATQATVIFFVTQPIAYAFTGTGGLIYVIYLGVFLLISVPTATLTAFFNHGNIALRILKSLAVVILPVMFINFLIKLTLQ